MGLFLQIVVFLIIAAALGFAVGWLLRGTRLEEESAGTEPLRARLDSAEQESSRLHGELAAAGEARAAAERAQREAAQSAAAGDPELTARVTRLERELEEAHAKESEQRSEIERLEMVIAELETGAAEAPAAVDLPADADAGDGPPEGLPGPDGEPDDLKRISGIGPGIEKTLHELGVFHFRQIAAFTPANVAWVNRRLRFKGRIEREDWIGQARTLASGGEPEARHS